MPNVLNCSLITATAAAVTGILPPHFSSDSSDHIPPHCKRKAHCFVSVRRYRTCTWNASDSAFVLDYDEVSRLPLAVLHKQDSSTSNLIYRSCQLSMQSLKAPCNSITKRLAPGLSLLRLAALQWGFGNELKRIYQWDYNMCPRAAVFFPLNPLRADRPLAGWALQVFQHLSVIKPRGRSHAGDYSNMRGEIGFCFGSLSVDMPSVWVLTNQEMFEKPEDSKSFACLKPH